MAETAENAEHEMVLAVQRDGKKESPEAEEILRTGTLVSVVQVVKLPDATFKVLVEGRRRVSISAFDQEAGYYQVEAQLVDEPTAPAVEIDPLVREVHGAFEAFVKFSRNLAPGILASVQSLDDPGQLADTIAGQLPLKVADKQKLLETAEAKERLIRLFEILKAEVALCQVERKVRSEVKRQTEKTKREQLVAKQLRELEAENRGAQAGTQAGGHGGDEFAKELDELEEKAAKLALTDEAKERFEGEMRKLRMTPPMSPESTVVRNYIDWILALPWGKRATGRIDVVAAEEILGAAHFGLDKVKERILEFLSVQSLVNGTRGTVLCLVGPPGVGKTSLARSVAEAMGRKFVRQALGGVRDESEIRGHRRTYVGAMPGKIIQALKRVGSENPVILLDEIDKMGSDFRGDPSSALLEVLDPEQNADFKTTTWICPTTCRTWCFWRRPMIFQASRRPWLTEWRLCTSLVTQRWKSLPSPGDTCFQSRLTQTASVN